MDANENEDLGVGVDGSLADRVDEAAVAGSAGGDLIGATERGADAAGDRQADVVGTDREEIASPDAAEAEDGQASSLHGHRKHHTGSIGATLCMIAVAFGLAISVGPPRLPWDRGPHYVVSKIATPDVLLAADGSTAPADVWRKNRHGAPYKRTIDVQLQFDAGCAPSAATAHVRKTGSRWMDLDLEFKPVGGKTCNGKKTEWTWWRVSVDGARDAGPSQTDYKSVLPLDDVTSVTASWDGWPGGKKGPLPQWKTQMDKLD